MHARDAHHRHTQNNNKAVFNPSLQELILILLVMLIVVGPKRLPEVARVLGRLTGKAKRLTENLYEMTQKPPLDPTSLVSPGPRDKSPSDKSPSDKSPSDKSTQTPTQTPDG